MNMSVYDCVLLWVWQCVCQWICLSVSVTVNDCVCLGVNQSSLCVYQSVSILVWQDGSQWECVILCDWQCVNQWMCYSVSLTVWQSVTVAAYECGNVVVNMWVWQYVSECVSLWVWQYKSVIECQSMSMSVCEWDIVYRWVRQFLSVTVCQSVNASICEPDSRHSSSSDTSHYNTKFSRTRFNGSKDIVWMYNHWNFES